MTPKQKQPKATLGNVEVFLELQPRSLKPQDALPFEYKALRLWGPNKRQGPMSKTGSETPPDPKKTRLKLRNTALMAVRKIKREVFHQEINGHFEQLAIITGCQMNPLKYCNSRLSLLTAAKNPGIYLPALTSTNKILNTRPKILT